MEEKDMISLISNIPGGAFSYTNDGKLEIDFISEAMLAILECTGEEFTARYGKSIDAVVHPDDFLYVNEQIKLDNEQSIEFEHRVITYKGHVKWLLVKKKNVKKSEELTKIFMSAIDITNLKKTQFALQREKERFDVVFLMNTEVIFEYSMSKDIMKIKKIKEEVKEDECIIRFKKTLEKSIKIHTRDRENFIRFFEKEEVDSLEFRYINEENRIYWCSIRGKVIEDPETEEKFKIGCISNINEQKKETEKLIMQTRMDPLTQLLNKKYTNIDVENFLENKGKSGKHALMIIDIDNFKAVNDNMGHLFGDNVLINIAENLKSIFVDSAIVGRIGGDEFLVLLKNVKNKETIDEKLAQVRESFSYTYVGENVDYKVACSIGVTWFPKDGTQYRELFKFADAALYKAKKSGKNNWVYYDSTLNPLVDDNESKFFYEYNVDDIKEQSQTNFDREMTIFAFDIMAKTKDVNSAINLVINRLGRKVNADHVMIMENSNDNKLQITYLWDRYHKKYNISDIQFEYKNFENFLQQFDDKDIMNVYDATGHMEQFFKNEELLKNSKVKSLLQCGMFENGVFKGCICIDDCHAKRDFTQTEIDCLTNITKILYSYLLKIRLSDRIQEKMDQVKNYDVLTNLPTLHNFKKIARKVIEENKDKQYAFVYSDISNFKFINDSLGYAVGDEVLCDFAKLLQKDNMQNVAACRVSSDNFMAMLPYYNKKILCERILFVNEEFVKKEKEKHPGSNMVIISGVTVIKPEEDIMIAIDNANIARKTGKSSSKASCNFYTEEMSNSIKKEIDITNTMEEALMNNEFNVYLQPKIELKTNKLVGAEALVRWIKPDGTMMKPDDFIPLFEKNGFIVNLDFFMYNSVCRLISKWIKSGMPVVPISVNVSRVHLYSNEFIESLCAVVDLYNIPYSCLELELTESIFLDNTDIALSTMRQLRSLGFGVSIDDFGAGYSSLNLLKDMNTDVLKLDKEFFGRLEMQKEDKIIVSSIISMAKQLNMKVLSEGVETEAQAEFLKDVYCDLAQGYFYAKPMPIYNFEEMLEKDKE